MYLDSIGAARFALQSDDNSGDYFTITAETNVEETDTNGEQSFVLIKDQFNQSGTAAGNSLKIWSVRTGSGDGSTGTGNNLITAGVDATGTYTEKVAVDTTGVMFFAESDTPTARTGMGSLYFKEDDMPYMQDLLGNEHQLGTISRYQRIEDFDDEASGVQLEAGLQADYFVSSGTNYADANVTYTSNAGGELAMLTAGSDDDSVTITGIANIAVDSNPRFECRWKIADITNAYVAVGLVEGSYVDKASTDDDVCVIGFDSDNGHSLGSDEIVLITNDNNGGLDYDDTGVAITNGTYVTVMIDLTDTEQPRAWVNGTEVAAGSISGTVQAGISVSAYLMVQSLSGAADTLTVDYFRVTQDR